MNKRLETFHITEFIKVYNNSIKLLSKIEEPDFICMLGASTFGIELTNLKKKKLSEIAGLQRKIVRNAEKLAISHGIPPVQVTVLFAPHLRRYGHEGINLATKYLHETISSNIERIKKGDGKEVKIPKTENRFSITSLTAHWNEINGQKWLPNHRWKTSEPGLVSRRFKAELQELLCKKSKRYSQYLKKCDSCWLVVVVDRTKGDEHFDYSKMDTHVYNSSFDKTILFDLVERSAYTLYTRKPFPFPQNH